jgi:putative Mg2+ transporter-C (MgtC) family protein
MDPVYEELLSLPTARDALVVGARLLAAALLGGLLGAERESEGKAAGLRTHMLVALGAALFVVAPQVAGAAEGDLGRIIQGVAAGIGFIGAGTILKRVDEEQIKGLTTAASIWLTAGIGVAAGIAPLWVPLVCAATAWAILYALGGLERRIGTEDGA